MRIKIKTFRLPYIMHTDEISLFKSIYWYNCYKNKILITELYIDEIPWFKGIIIYQKMTHT
jgi:hypothetical protein